MARKLIYREKLLAIITGVLTVLYLFERFITTIVSPQSETLQREIIDKSILLERYQHVINSEILIQKNYDKFINKIRLKGTIDEAISDLLQEIDIICKKAGVRISDMKPASTKTIDHFQRIRVEIQFEANQQNIGKLLLYLSQSESIINIDHLRIVASLENNLLQCHLYLSRLVAL